MLFSYKTLAITTTITVVIANEQEFPCVLIGIYS